MLYLLIFSGIYLFITQFQKKLIPLLCLELIMVSFIWGSFCFYSDYIQSSSFCLGLILLVFMVLDSVLGITLLVLSCRFSDFVSLNFF